MEDTRLNQVHRNMKRGEDEKKMSKEIMTQIENANTLRLNMVVWNQPVPSANGQAVLSVVYNGCGVSVSERHEILRGEKKVSFPFEVLFPCGMQNTRHEANRYFVLRECLTSKERPDKDANRFQSKKR